MRKYAGRHGQKKFDFEDAVKACESSSELSARVVEDFLMYYAARQEHLDKELDTKLSGYRDVVRLMDNESWLSGLKAQYIVHRLFKEGGLIGKYLGHNAVRQLGDKEVEYLRFQARHPWRFSFSVIADEPAKQFYEMEDVFRGERFILYSPGTDYTLSANTVELWFNLIGFNGKCWQTFGPIIPFRGFETDDIWFFATELNRSIEDEAGIIADVEKNPLPYCLLISGSEFPVTVAGKNRIVFVSAEYDLPSFSGESLGDGFYVEYNRNVYRLSPKKWSEPPHYGEGYYDEKRRSLILTAMSDRGFAALGGMLKQKGFDVSDEPQIRVSPAMIVTAERILRRKIRLNPYESLFEKERSFEQRREMEKLNQLLQLILPDINAGREPDIEALALKVGVDPLLAKHVVGQAVKRAKKLRGS